MPLRHRNLLVAAVIPLLLLTTSCVRMKANYEIKSEDKVNVAIDVGISKEVSGGGGTGAPTSDSLCGKDSPLAKHPGATNEPYEDDQYVGCRSSATVAAADLRKEDAARVTLNDDIWEFTFKVADTDSRMSAEMVSDFEIKVTFPGKVIEASGSGKIKGNTVTWSDPRDALTAEGLSAKAKNGGALAALPWALIVIVVLALAVGAGLLFFLLGRRKNSPQPQQPSAGYPPQPGGSYPQQPGPGYSQQQSRHFPQGGQAQSSGWENPQQPGTGYPQQGGGYSQQQSGHYPQGGQAQPTGWENSQQRFSGQPQQPGPGHMQQSGSGYPQESGSYPQQPGGYSQDSGSYPQQAQGEYGQQPGQVSPPQQPYSPEQESYPVDEQAYYSEPQQPHPDDPWRRSQ